MAEADNELASILADVERVLGKGTKRGPAHRSTSMHLASGVLCFQTTRTPPYSVAAISATASSASPSRLKNGSNSTPVSFASTTTLRKKSTKRPKTTKSPTPQLWPTAPPCPTPLQQNPHCYPQRRGCQPDFSLRKIRLTIVGRAHLCGFCSSRRAIKSFIACVLHAMSIDILAPDEGAKLLSGARTAALTLNRKHTRDKCDKNAAGKSVERETHEQEITCTTEAAA